MNEYVNKIIEFGMIPIHARYTSSKCIPRKSLFGADFALAEIINPYFFQNEAGVAITVNGERYRSMISNFLWPKMDDMDTDNMCVPTEWHTRATPHATIDILHEI